MILRSIGRVISSKLNNSMAEILLLYRKRHTTNAIILKHVKMSCTHYIFQTLTSALVIPVNIWRLVKSLSITLIVPVHRGLMEYFAKSVCFVLWLLVVTFKTEIM